MLDPGVAVRGAAQLVAQHDHAAQQGRESASSGIHGHQLARLRCGVEPAQEHVRVGVDDDPPGHRGGQGAVPGDAGRCLLAAEQGPVGHHQVHLDRGGTGGGLAGEAFDQGVGQNLGRGASLGLAEGHEAGGGLGQGTVAGCGLGQRQGRGEGGHPVIRRPDGDPAFGHRGVEMLRGGCRVLFHGQLPGRHRQLLGAEHAQPVDQGGVHPAPGGARGQPGGLPVHHPGPFLRDRSLGQRRQGVRQVLGQGARQGQLSRAAVRGLTAGQAQLPAQASSLPLGRHPAGGLGGAAQGVKGGCLTRLGGRAGGLELLQHTDAVHGLCLGVSRDHQRHGHPHREQVPGRVRYRGRGDRTGDHGAQRRPAGRQVRRPLRGPHHGDPPVTGRAAGRVAGPWRPVIRTAVIEHVY